LSEITRAIQARQTQITQLQSDIDTLQRAASLVGRKGATATATSQKATGQPKTETKPEPRQNPMRNGLEINPLTGKKWSSTMCFAWFIWEHDYTGEPIIRWL